MSSPPLKKMKLELQGETPMASSIYYNSCCQLYESHESCEDVMTIPDFFPFSTTLPKFLFVRQCYRKLAELVQSKLRSYPEPSRSKQICVISGTPGIGKTCFLIFLLCTLFTADFVVAFPDTMNVLLWYIFTKTGCTIASYTELAEHRYGSKVVVLLDQIFGQSTSDALKKIGYEYFTILATSPDKDKIKIKNTFMSRVVFYMPIWKEEETTTFYKKLKDRYAYSCITEAELKKRFNRWGGIPRILFMDKDTYSDTNRDLCFVLKDQAVLKGIIDRTHANSSLLDESFSQRAQFVTHMIVDETEFKSFVYDWPSLEIMEEAFLASKEFSNLFSTRLFSSGTFYGKLYERCVLEQLKNCINNRKTVTSLKAIPLQSKKSKSKESACMRINLPSSYQNVDLSEQKALPPSDCLWIPTSRTQASLDLVQPPFIYQVTTAKKQHDVKRKGIEQCLKCFPSILEKDWKLIFITPKDGLNKAQTIDGFNDISQYKTIMDFKENLMEDDDADSIVLCYNSNQDSDYEDSETE